MRRFFQFVLSFFLLAQITNAWGSDTQFVRISPTLSGPSGLLFTQSADTLAPGEIDVGIGFSYEHHTSPRLTLETLSPTLTLGLPGRLELSARGPYARLTTSNSKEDGFQDVDFTVKWRFLDYNKDYNLPAFGLSLTYYAPGNQALSTVGGWGLKMLIVSSAEIVLGGPDQVLVGLYADGGIFIQDLNKPWEEKHAQVDLGILFPLTEENDVHLFMEGNETFKNQGLEGNYLGITGGLRYVTSHLNLSAGIQPLFQTDKGKGSTNRFILQASYLF